MPEGAIVRAVETGLVAAEGLPFGVGLADGEGGASGLVESGFSFVESGSGEVHFAFGLHPEDARLAPFVDGHFLDDAEFGGGFGLEFGDQFVEQLLELSWGFVGEDDDIGGEPVGDRVEGGIVFAFAGGGSVG